MPQTDLLILLMFLMVVFGSCTSYFIVKFGAHKGWNGSTFVRALSIGLLVIYTITLFVLTLVAREIRTDGLVFWIPFENFYFIIKNGYPWYYDNIVVNSIINVILFLPIGFLGYEILRRKKLLFSVLIGFVITLVIELTQLITQLGVFDIDDIIFNTLGTLLGCGLFALCRKVYERATKKQD